MYGGQERGVGSVWDKMLKIARPMELSVAAIHPKAYIGVTIL
jgi:hypothetical protein